MKISIVICTYNRSKDLEKVMVSLGKTMLPKEHEYEIIIVDNKSTDDTKDVVNKFIKGSTLKMIYSFESKQGLSNARNHGIEIASGDIIIFTDDDTVVAPDWAKSLLECFMMFNCDCVGGRVMPVYSEANPQWIRSNPRQFTGGVVMYDYGTENIRFNSSMYPFIGANFAFKREVFQECGLFDNHLGSGTKMLIGEDTEFIERLQKKEKTLYYCGKSTVYHPVDNKRLTLRHFAKWHLGLGRYYAWKQIRSKEKFICYFGVPRYLLKELMKDCLRFFVSLDRLSFYDTWRIFFCRVGTIQGFLESSKKKDDDLCSK